MSRFYEPDQDTIDLVEEIIRERFPYLRNANIISIMDGKERISKTNDTVEFAYIKRANDMENFLVHSMDGNIDEDENVDYFMFLHSLVWEISSVDNKKRIISHELRHTFLDEKGRYKLVAHEVTDFYAEIKLNSEEPRWGQDLAEIVRLTYEQRKEDGAL